VVGYKLFIFTNHQSPLPPMDHTKTYDNGEIKILWQPKLCIHCGNCFRGLPAVFDPRRRPWIMPENASSGEIIVQVTKCPSRALSIVE
jgi:uncharacterized Fe-S cluster protein YjdI